MRAAVRRVVATAFVIGSLAVMTTAGAQTPPTKPFSGTIDPGNGHVLSYSLTGVEPIPAGQPALEGFDGVVSDGDTVTLSGQTTFSIGEGLVTNLGMSASLSGTGIEPQSASWVNPSPDGRFGGPATAEFPFNLTADVVLPPPPSEDPFASPTTEGQVVPVGSISASASSSNCNDVGVCGGASISFNIAVVPGGGDGGLSPGLIVAVGGAAAAAAGAGAVIVRRGRRRRRGRRPTGRRQAAPQPPPPPPPPPPVPPPPPPPAPRDSIAVGAPGVAPPPGSPQIFVQQQDDTCGPTSMRMVINRITGQDIPEDRIADRSHRLPGGYRNNGGPTWNPWGTNAGAINDQLNRLGFDSRQGAFTTDQIAQALRDGKQVIILHDIPGPDDGGHFQVVAGVEEGANGRQVFTLNDPWTGRAYRRSELWFGRWVRSRWTTIVGPRAQP